MRSGTPRLVGRGRLGSQHFQAKVAIGGRPVTEHDPHRVLEASASRTVRGGRVTTPTMLSRETST